MLRSLAACVIARLLGRPARGRITTTLPIRRAEISAVVTRKDGTVEDLGVIASMGAPK